MKRQTIYIAVVALMAGMFSSCSDFLNEELKGNYNSKTFYTSETNALRGMNGVYNAIRFTSSENMIWVFGDVASDDSQKGGNPGDLSDAELIDLFQAKADNGIVNNYWQFSYDAISRANELIDNVPSISMDQSLKERLIGEAKFVRAYSYFNLVNIWGQVPLRLKPLALDNLDVPLSSVDAVYAQIESDLNDALSSPILPEYSSSEDKGRVTKGAVYALLAKTYLYQKKYAECVTAVQNVEVLGIYQLDDYSKLFKIGAENSPEAIFAIRHMSDQNPGLNNILNVYFAPSHENGYYFNAPTDSYVAAFDERTTTNEDDPRLDISIGRSGKPWLNGNTFDPTWSSTGYLVKKHNQPASEVDFGRKSNGSLPYIYLRYADILLMKAEALNERNQGNDFNDAKAALDRVRNRANLRNTLAGNQYNLRLAIQKERRRELGFEFHRFFDLMRWGKDVATAALGTNFKWEEPRFYFPIPQGEKDTNNAI